MYKTIPTAVGAGPDGRPKGPQCVRKLHPWTQRAKSDDVE
jgi:hypothetical protein